MTMNGARKSLFYIFLFCLLVQLSAYLFVGHKMWPEDLRLIVFKLLGIYSVQFSVIIGGILATPKDKLERPSAALVWAAILLTVLWNMLFVWRSLVFAFATEDSAAELLKYMDGATSSSSFLVTGVLAFFFTKGAQTPRAGTKSR